MRKFLALMLVMALALFIFTACGGNGNGNNTGDSNTTQPTETPATNMPEPTPPGSGNGQNEDGNGNEQGENDNESTGYEPEEDWPYIPVGAFTTRRNNQFGGLEIAGYTGNEQRVRIPNEINGTPVVAIGYSAFRNTQITHVIIPDSVNEIGQQAFADTLLTSIDIPDSVYRIGVGAFQNTQLTNVTIGPGMTDFAPVSLFAGASVARFTVSPENPMYHDTDGVLFARHAGYYILVHFPQVRTGAYSIPDEVTFILPGAFLDSQLTSVTIPDSLTNIQYELFANSQIANLIAGSNNPIFHDIDGVLFRQDENNLILTHFPPGRTGSYIVPNGVTSIGIGAFASTQLTNITIPNSVTSIEVRAFINSQLSSITISDSVTSIGNWAFYNTSLDETSRQRIYAINPNALN